MITPYIARWYFARVLSGIEGVLQDSELDLLLSSIGDPSETHRVPPHRKLRRRVDGFLVISLPTDTEGVSEIFDLDLPVALIDTDRDGCSSVGIDDVQGARMAVQHLINLGHERIGLISGPSAPDAVPAGGEPLRRLPRHPASRRASRSTPTSRRAATSRSRAASAR